MTCCIVLINPEATAASLPPLTIRHSGRSSATTGALTSSRERVPPSPEAPYKASPSSGEDLVAAPPGLNVPAQATAVP